MPIFPAAILATVSNRSRKVAIRRAHLRLQTVALFFAVLFATGSVSFAQSEYKRYTILLEDPPAAAKYASRESLHSPEALTYRQRIEAKQRALRTALESKHIQVTGSVSTLLNAIFVAAPQSSVADMKSLPGVLGVVPQRQYHRSLNRATQLLNAPAAWNTLGGQTNAGAGMKIAILDSGIDQTHPSFQDSSLAMPAGFPICKGGDCAFTNNKVIVARSYVSQLAAGSSATNPALDSRPDDISPRDRDGHGTAVASCAAGGPSTGVVPIMGMAPKAYLGNYKIYGSPGVNDFTEDSVMIQALEDAHNDGMDVANLSSGGPALSGPLDVGPLCGNDAGVACDPLAVAFENAAKTGMIVVASAGNEGFDGANYPTFNSVGSPADAPSVIGVGAVTNSHVFIPAVHVEGSAPANLKALPAQYSDANSPFGAATAPMLDVTQTGDSGLACAALPAGSLGGRFALIKRGSCNFSTKAGNAVNAGAVGVVFYMDSSATPINPSGLGDFFMPIYMISNSDGILLKSYLDSNPNASVTIDPSGIEQSATANQLAGFSSVGPATGTSALKPDLVAIGEGDGLNPGVYMAAQNFDPQGELYSSNRFAAADGTSFSSPLTAGAAALVKQHHPNFTAAQVKSALVNYASQNVTLDDAGNQVGILALGGGEVDAGAAVNATVTASPSTLSFGALGGGVTLPLTQQVQLTNTSSTTIIFTISATSTTGGAVTTDKQSLTLGPNTSGSFNASLAGTVPTGGAYSGNITATGGGITLRIPYLYVVGIGSAANIIPLTGSTFDGTVGQVIPDGFISFKLVDANGVPVANAPITWSAPSGGTLSQQSTVTDNYGIGYAVPTLGSQTGSYEFDATAGGQTISFTGQARAVPTIAANGIVNAASSQAGQGVAPGSYISIFGSNLSDFTDNPILEANGALPIGIDFATVSFDVPSAGISVPGHVTYVSPTQVNVQVPWELQGQTSAQVKINIDYSNGNVITVPIVAYSPAFFLGANGSVAALNANFQAITSSNPVARGQVAQLYANGLGPVTNQPASGDPAPSSTLARTTTLPTVTIGGQNAPVSFSGLAPGFAGLYQVNVTVPSSLAPGTYPVVLSIGNQTTTSGSISVQ